MVPHLIFKDKQETQEKTQATERIITLGSWEGVSGDKALAV